MMFDQLAGERVVLDFDCVFCLSTLLYIVLLKI